ncbi:MAG: histidine kinase [Thermoanaerobaculia bacterium]|nr:histidine kinase [Thermoanaerobaculia bacterium]
MERLNWTRIAYHISFWLVYLFLNSWLGSIFNRVDWGLAFLGETFVLPVKILLTYFVFYYIIPLYLDRDKVYKLVGLTLLAFIVASLLYRTVTAFIFFPIFEPERNIPFFFLPGFYLTAFDLFITVAAATTIKMIRVHYKSLEFEQQLLREKLQSELNFLRAQTNPHFLFNTLNNLYVLARKKSDRTADAIMMLSKIMRFVLYECRSPRIPVADESKIIQDYIELEKLRYNNRLSVQFEESIEQPGGSIAPLLLLPFVENSFKHGANSTTGDANISVSLSLKNNVLDFMVRNTVEPGERPASSEGIGLKNVQRQLDLIYPDRYELALEQENGTYTARLRVKLEED